MTTEKDKNEEAELSIDELNSILNSFQQESNWKQELKEEDLIS